MSKLRLDRAKAKVLPLKPRKVRRAEVALAGWTVVDARYHFRPTSLSRGFIVLDRLGNTVARAMHEEVAWMDAWQMLQGRIAATGRP